MSIDPKLLMGVTVTHQKRTDINLNESYETRYWCQMFECTEEELHNAVKNVGTSPDAIEEYLNQSEGDNSDTHLMKTKNRENSLYEDSTEEEEEVDFSDYDISASPNDFNTKTLFDFISSGIVKIPGFQRNYVWDIKRASKLIESLIIGLPIPQIFLYQEAKNKFIVIDGQQRYMTIYYFIKKRFPRKEKRFELRQYFNAHGEIPKEILANKEYFTDFDLNLVSKLPNQVNKYNKKNYDTLDADSKTSFDLRTIRNVIIKQNAPDEAHSAVYEIFNRLNSGGVNLKPQEIRSSLYHSAFYDMLYDINMVALWRNFTPQPTPDLNMRDIEIVLRGFAMLESWHEYTPSMTRFLNSYSEKAKKKSEQTLAYLKELFLAFLKACATLDSKAFFSENNKFSISFFESVFVASCHKCFAERTTNVISINGDSINTLKQDSEFIKASQFDTAGTSNVKMRIQRAIEILN